MIHFTNIFKISRIDYQKCYFDKNHFLIRPTFARIIHKNGFVELSKDSEPSKLSLIEVKNIIKENKPAKSKKKTK